ncbi:putative cysteine alpha-hairpin motif superfamily [Fagus crenata]
MEKEGVGENEKQPVCGEQALDLLNCVTQSPYDQDKCLRLLQSLRDCVLNKKVKKFSLADQEQREANPTDKKA